MRLAYFGNDIFLNCFQYLVDGDRDTILKLFSVVYGKEEYHFAQSTRQLASEMDIPSRQLSSPPRLLAKRRGVPTLKKGMLARMLGEKHPVRHDPSDWQGASNRFSTCVTLARLTPR